MLRICGVHKSLFPVLISLALTACSAVSEVAPASPVMVKVTPTVLPSPPTSTPTITAVETALMPTATPTLSPDQVSAEQFARPILEAIADRPPDYADEFSHPSGWFMALGSLGSADRGTAEYKDGKLLLATAPIPGRWVRPPVPRLTNLVLQIDVAFDTCADITVTWRQWFVETSGESYEQGFLFSPSCNNKTWSTQVMSRSGKYSNQGHSLSGYTQGSFNTFVVVAYGSRHAIFLNGLPLTYIENDEVLSAGDITFGLHGGAVAFDNLKVWNLDRVGGLPME